MKLTLGQVLALSLLGLAATLGFLFAIVLSESRAAIMESSERIRDQASREITERVRSFLLTAPDTVSAFQQQIKLGLVDPDDPQMVRPPYSRCCWPRATSARSPSLTPYRPGSTRRVRSCLPPRRDGN